MFRGAGIEALGLTGVRGLSVTRFITADALYAAALGVWWARVLAERMLAGRLISACNQRVRMISRRLVGGGPARQRSSTGRFDQRPASVTVY